MVRWSPRFRRRRTATLAPWSRATRLLRQYLPRKTRLGDRTQIELDADETIGLADSPYSRSADSVDGLADEQWVVFPTNGVDEITALAEDDPQAAFLMVTGLDFDGDGDGEIDADFDDDEAFLDEALIPGLPGYYLFGLGEPSGRMGPAPAPLPSGFVDAFGSFEDGEVVSDDGETLTIRATRTCRPRSPTGSTSTCRPACSRSRWAPTTCRPSSR
jgi:hypothetical protein